MNPKLNSQPITNSTTGQANLSIQQRVTPNPKIGMQNISYYKHSPTPHKLIFSSKAWLKWQYLCHVGPTEVAGFGLSNADNPLYLDDVLMIRQRASSVTVSFDDHAVADLFDEMADHNIPPQRFARIWLHTHPGSSVIPSGIDEETFQRCFGTCDWAVMAILGRTGKTSARIRFRAGPGLSMEIPTYVDWSGWPKIVEDESFPQSISRWMHEYQMLVSIEESCFTPFRIDSNELGSDYQPKPQSTPAHFPTFLPKIENLKQGIDARIPSIDSFDPHEPQSK